MRTADVLLNGKKVGNLAEIIYQERYEFDYCAGYSGPPISLTMPVSNQLFTYDRFPPFFDGLLLEGIMLDGLLRQQKIDTNDYFSQLIAVGNELVGAVSVRANNE